MMPATHLTDRSPQAAAPSRTGQTVEALADALRSEARLLADLTAIMRRQREAVGRDDLDGVDDSVFATHRVLVTLGEARRRRRSLNNLLGESDDLSVAALRNFFADAMPGDVRVAADQLAAAARVLQREVDVTRRVLRQAIRSGEEFVRSLCGASASASSNYAPDAAPAFHPAGGVILDRTV